MSYPEELIETMWQKADATPRPDLRLDYICHALIRREDYGNLNSDFGWVIGPKDANHPALGPDDLIPLHWANDASRQFGRVVCVRRANQLLDGNVDV
ncbi:MAG: hypothetical protein ACYC8U_15500 [Thermoleophilia bacterium]